MQTVCSIYGPFQLQRTEVDLCDPCPISLRCLGDSFVSSCLCVCDGAMLPMSLRLCIFFCDVSVVNPALPFTEGGRHRCLFAIPEYGDLDLVARPLGFQERRVTTEVRHRLAVESDEDVAG